MAGIRKRFIHIFTAPASPSILTYVELERVFPQPHDRRRSTFPGTRHNWFREEGLIGLLQHVHVEQEESV
jgi:hypothetical protein